MLEVGDLVSDGDTVLFQFPLVVYLFSYSGYFLCNFEVCRVYYSN